jgi:hypothetical protein
LGRNVYIGADIHLVTEQCCNCGVLFALPDQLRRQLLDHPRRQFWCPNGHGQWYVGETEAQQLKRHAEQLERALAAEQAVATHERDQRRAAERSNAALRAVNTRTRRRIAAGVCPCCRRTFQDLASHMAGQHPQYAEGDQT